MLSLCIFHLVIFWLIFKLNPIYIQSSNSNNVSSCQLSENEHAGLFASKVVNFWKHEQKRITFYQNGRVLKMVS